MIKKKTLFIIKISLLLFYIIPAKAQFDIKAPTAILQDFLSGEILFEKEADRSIYPASMTKIMTAIVAFDLIENIIMGIGVYNQNYKSAGQKIIETQKNNFGGVSIFSYTVFKNDPVYSKKLNKYME